jgi:hypothetical protein
MKSVKIEKAKNCQIYNRYSMRMNRNTTNLFRLQGNASFQQRCGSVNFVRAVKAESRSVSYTHTCFVWGRKRDRGRGRPHPTWEMFWDMFEEL